MKSAKKIIFIVEDDQDILELMQIVIENENFTVKTFMDSEKAEREIELKKPDLLIMDLYIGGNDGAILVKNLKSAKGTKKMPVIIVSAKNSLEDIAHSCKAEGYLKKPFNIKDLTDLIKQLI
jgi:DNA-binding response OmpR family regulator